MSNPPPVTVTEAYGQTGIPRRTLQWAITRGELTARKTGGKTSGYLIEQRDLDDYVSRRSSLRDTG